MWHMGTFSFLTIGCGLISRRGQLGSQPARKERSMWLGHAPLPACVPSCAQGQTARLPTAATPPPLCT